MPGVISCRAAVAAARCSGEVINYGFHELIRCDVAEKRYRTCQQQLLSQDLRPRLPYAVESAVIREHLDRTCQRRNVCLRIWFPGQCDHAEPVRKLEAGPRQLHLNHERAQHHLDRYEERRLLLQHQLHLFPHRHRHQQLSDAVCQRHQRGPVERLYQQQLQLHGAGGAFRHKRGPVWRQLRRRI